MIYATEFVDLSNAHNYPAERFDDWDHDSKLHLLLTWAYSCDEECRKELLEEALFEGLNVVLGDRINELVDSVHGEEPQHKPWGNA